MVVRTYCHEAGDARVWLLQQVQLEEGPAVVLVVRPQQGLQDDIIVGDAPGMQVADQHLQWQTSMSGEQCGILTASGNGVCSLSNQHG